MAIIQQYRSVLTQRAIIGELSVAFFSCWSPCFVIGHKNTNAYNSLNLHKRSSVLAWPVFVRIINRRFCSNKISLAQSIAPCCVRVSLFELVLTRLVSCAIKAALVSEDSGRNGGESNAKARSYKRKWQSLSLSIQLALFLSAMLAFSILLSQIETQLHTLREAAYKRALYKRIGVANNF